MHLTITTTLLRAAAVSRITSARSSRTPTIVASSFRRGLRVTSEDSETLDSEERDDFDDPRIIDRLALASRSTPRSRSRSKPASCRSRKRRTTAPTWMACGFEEISRYVVDGGVLAGRPRCGPRSARSSPSPPDPRSASGGLCRARPGRGHEGDGRRSGEVPELAEIATASLVPPLATRRSATSSLNSTTCNTRVDAQRPAT